MKKDNIINVENYKENLICSPNYTFKLVYCKFITSTLMLNYVASLKHKIKKKAFYFHVFLFEIIV